MKQEGSWSYQGTMPAFIPLANWSEGLSLWHRRIILVLAWIRSTHDVHWMMLCHWMQDIPLPKHEFHVCCHKCLRSRPIGKKYDVQSQRITSHSAVFLWFTLLGIFVDKVTACWKISSQSILCNEEHASRTDLSLEALAFPLFPPKIPPVEFDLGALLPAGFGCNSSPSLHLSYCH